jgi:hypothetical protein
MTRLQLTVTRAFAEQVERTLAVARIQGYVFPAHADIGVLLLSDLPDHYKVKARMDDVLVEAVINVETEAADVLKAVDRLVAPWLTRYAKTKAG